MKQNGIQTAITYLYYTLFFVTPFIVLPITSELFEFNKILFIYAVAGLIFSLWAVDSLRTGALIWKRTPLDIPLAIFFISQLLSYIFSIDRHTSFFGYYGRFNGGLLSLMVYIFLYFAFMLYVAQQKNAVRRILGIISVSIILVFLWGVPGLFNRDLSCLLFVGVFDNSCWTAQFRPAERMFSTLGQPNWLGAYAAISLFTSFYLALTTKRKSIAVFCSVAIVSAFCALLYSRSRSSLLSLTPGIILFSLAVLLLRKNLTQHLKEIKIIGIVLFLVLTIALFSIKTGIPSVDRVLTFYTKTSNVQSQPLHEQNNTTSEQGSEPSIQVGGVTESLEIRRIVWKGAWELGSQYPLFGTGLETFGYAYYNVRPKEHNLTSEWDYLYNKAHNEFLHIFATSGWIGLVSYLLFIVWLVSIILRSFFIPHSHFSDTLLRVHVLAVYGSLIVTNFFGFSTTTINIFWYVLPAMVMVRDRGNRESQHEHYKHASFRDWAIGGAVYIIILNYLASYWYADYLYAQSDALAKNYALENSVILLDKARSLRYEHVYDDKQSYLLAQLAFGQLQQSRKESVPALISRADELNMQSIRASNQNILYWKTRVKNQYLFYQAVLDKKYLFTGLSALDESKKLAPTDPKIPYFASTYYTLLFDDEQNKEQRQAYMDKSLEEVDNAIVLKNNYLDAYTLKIQLLKKYQKKDDLKAFLEFYLTQVAPNDQSAKAEYEAL